MTDNKLFTAAALALAAGSALAAREKPNVVFLMAEDLSRESFALYTGHGAQTPFLEEMARHGVVYQNAYSCAPVSSAARSSLFTGCYAPSLGLSWHRKLEAVTLPEGIHLFPKFLKEAGYYTTNCNKTDYNFVMEDGAWDKPKGEMGAWRKRPDKAMPFFEVVTDNYCHEHSLHFPESDMGSVSTFHSPDDVHILPCHPDTPLFRYTYARHYDAIREVDKRLGRIMDMLREDGELDDTFIFYIGDNGGCLPGTKGYTTDLGLHVPIVVYIPDNWKHYSAVKPGGECNAVISFLDLAPTLLNLAGVQIPAYMDGQPILGPGVEGTDLENMDMTVCYGDRFDELISVNRVVRKQDYNYSRNFYPYQPKSLYGYYRMHQAAFREWYKLHDEGKLNPVQDKFFQPQGAEELYLLSSDRFETVNLASKPDYAQVLGKMRSILDDKMRSEMDLTVIPEMFWVGSVSDIEGYKASIRDRYDDYLAAANIVRQDWKDAAPAVRKALASKDEVIRFWGLVACNTYGADALKLKSAIRKIAAKDTPILRSKAVLYLSRFDGMEASPAFNKCLDDGRNRSERLYVLGDAALAVTFGVAVHIDPEKIENETYEKERMKFINK